MCIQYFRIKFLRYVRIEPIMSVGRSVDRSLGLALRLVFRVIFFPFGILCCRISSFCHTTCNRLSKWILCTAHWNGIYIFDMAKTRMQSYYIIFHSLILLSVVCRLLSIRFNSVELSSVQISLAQFHFYLSHKFAIHVLFATICWPVAFFLPIQCCFALLSRSLVFHKRGHNRFKTIWQCYWI